LKITSNVPKPTKHQQSPNHVQHNKRWWWHDLLVVSKDVLFLALDWQRIGPRLFRLWHTASLYCRHVTSG